MNIDIDIKVCYTTLQISWVASISEAVIIKTSVVSKARYSSIATSALSAHFAQYGCSTCKKREQQQKTPQQKRFSAE